MTSVGEQTHPTEALVDRIRRIEPSEAAALLPYATALAALLAVAVVMLQRWTQVPSPYGRTIVSWAGLAFVVAAAFGATNRRVGAFSLPRAMSPRGFTAYILALEVGILLMPIVVYASVWRNRYDDLSGWTYPFLNKRWLVALYGVAVATVLVFPSAVDRWLRHTPVEHEAVRPATTARGVRRWRDRLRLAGGIVAALFVAWYFAGPPWHVDRHHRAIDFHEQVHLGPLQAIDKGYLPAVGPASTQYGPGSQVFTYAWMKLSGRFDIVSFREAELAIHLLTFAAVAVIAYLTAGFWAMLLIVLLGAAYSPLAFFSSAGDGTVIGAYGWGNGLRYLGPLLVVPSVARVACAPRARLMPIGSAIALGVVWGFFAWVSQENLVSTLVASVLLLLVLWLTRTVSAHSALSVAGSMAAGFAAVWAVILVFYAAHGAAREFVRDYLLVASAVAMGFSNTWWPAGDSPADLGAYYFTAPFLIALGVATLSDLPSLSLRRDLDNRQVRLLAFTCVLLACFQTSLYRSDSAHVMNTMLALPFVLVLATRDLPEWTAETWPARAGLRALLVAFAVYVYPVSRVFVDLDGWMIGRPLARFRTPPSVSSVAKDGRPPFRRATRYLADEPQTTAGMVPMRTFLEAASALREVIGTRRTYVDGVIAGGYTGLYYFMLDLTPGPFLLDKETMIINNALAGEAFDHFRRHAREFDAVLTADPQSREAQTFLATHPSAVILQRAIGTTPVYVLLTDRTQ